MIAPTIVSKGRVIFGVLQSEADRPRYLRTVSLSCPWLHIMNLLQGEWVSPTFQFLFSLCIHQGQVLYKEEKKPSVMSSSKMSDRKLPHV